MYIREILNKIELGSSVAEFDKDLSKYFLETQPFRLLIGSKKDIVAGDKGTGKTAIFKAIGERYRTLEDLANVEIVAAFNPAGNPVFQKLNAQAILEETEYGKLWKAYIFALVGNWILGIYDASHSPKVKLLEQVLEGLDLRTPDDWPRTVFDRIISKIGSFFKWKKAEVEFVYNTSGTFSVIPRVDFDKDKPVASTEISVEAALGTLEACLEELGHICWVALDRLDEAFQGMPEVEVPALRALLRTYLDMSEFRNIRLKLFIRKDLFRRIIDEDFVNLTHVNAQKVEVNWNDDDLKSMLMRRVRQNNEVMKILGLENSSDDDIFSALFPQKVDQGLRKPQTWVWMMRRVRDGNDVKPPRNLIDLVSLARDEQIKKEGRVPRQWAKGEPLIEAESLRAALDQLSKSRVQDTLIAETGPFAKDIRAFAGGKAEHNDTSIAAVLKIDAIAVKDRVKPLMDIGFLELIKNTRTYKIPALYRSGLEITQGRAFSEEGEQLEGDEDDRE